LACCLYNDGVVQAVTFAISSIGEFLVERICPQITAYKSLPVAWTSSLSVNTALIKVNVDLYRSEHAFNALPLHVRRR